MIDGARCPDIIKQCKPLIQKAYDTNRRGTIMEDMRIIESTINSGIGGNVTQPYEEKKAKALDPEIRNVLQAMQSTGFLDVSSTDNAIHHQHVTIAGLKYRGSPRHKELIFIRSSDVQTWLPATVRQIFSLPARDGTAVVLLAIHRLSAAPSGMKDPFERWKDFGASVWGNESETLEIVKATDGICPGNKRPWRDGWVVRPLDKVHLSILGLRKVLIVGRIFDQLCPLRG